MATQTGPRTLDVSTALAYDRTRLVYERTLMAWVRTGVSLISFQEFHKAEHVPQASGLFGAREFGLIMIAPKYNRSLPLCWLTCDREPWSSLVISAYGYGA